MKKKFFKRFRYLFIFLFVGLISIIPVTKCNSPVVKALSPQFDFVQSDPSGYTFTIDLATFSDYLHDGGPNDVDDFIVYGNFNWNDYSYNSMFFDFVDRYIYFDTNLMYSINDSIDNIGNHLTITYTSQTTSNYNYYLNQLLNTFYSDMHKYVDVTIYSNGGTIENTDNGNFYNNIQFTYDATVSTLISYFNQYYSNYVFTRTNYNYLGLSNLISTSTPLLDTQINNLGINNTNVVLYAVWEQIQVQQYTLSFNANGGTGTLPSNITANAGTIINLTYQVSNLERSGFEFLGWSTNSSATSIMQSITLNNNTIVYAVWRSQTGTQYTITFNGNGATSGNPPSFTNAFYGDDFYLYNVGQNTLYRTGYVFLGWNTNSSATSGLDHVHVTSDVTLYAIWSNNLIYLQEKYFYFDTHLGGLASNFNFDMYFLSNSQLFKSITYIDGSLYYDNVQVYTNNTWLNESYRQILISNNYISQYSYNVFLIAGVFTFVNTSPSYDLYDLFIGIADVPVKTLSGFLGFEFLGYTLFAVFCGLLTVVVIIWVVKRFI